MKILFFIPTLGAGGAERALLQLVNNYVCASDEIYVKTLFKQGKYINDLKSDVHYSYVFRKCFRGNIHIFKMFSPDFLFKHMITEKYDVIISFLEGPTTRIISGCNDKKTKIINWIHTSPDKETVLCSSYRNKAEMIRCYQKYSETVFVAETARKSFFDLFPQLSDITANVIYNPIDLNQIKRRALSKVDFNYNVDEFNLISVGRLMPVKGFERLIKICNKLYKEDMLNIHLYIIGDGSEAKKLGQVIQQNNCDGYITLLGYKENPYPYIAQGNLYVCSSFREGYSTSVIESLVLGVPVVTTECSGMREILGENSEYGLIVENNEEELYNGIRYLIQDKKKYEFYKKKAAVRGNDFQLKNVMEQINGLIKEK